MGLHLMLYDAPNIDMAIGNILNRRPLSDDRPDFAAVKAWMDRRRCAPECLVEACIFINVPEEPGPRARLAGWVVYLKQTGFEVFAKPKQNGSGDIDEDMLSHLELRLQQGELEDLVVVSNDARNWLQPLQKAAIEVACVTAIGFAESASRLVDCEQFEFIDLEDIQGIFNQPLPGRVHLAGLPAAGAWI